MRKSVKLVAQATAVALAFGLAATASAGEKAAPKVVKRTQIEVPRVDNDLVAGVDPVTGKLRQPTSKEFQALSEQMVKMFAAAPTSVTVTEYADGTLSADLGEAFMNMTLVRINPDGTTSEACVETLGQALEFFAQTPAPAYEEK